MASASKRRRKDEAPGIAAGSNDGGRAFYREQLSEEGLRSGATQIQNVFNKDGGFQSTQSLASGESGGDVVACKPQGSMFGNFKESDSPLSLRADTEPNSVPQNGNGGPQHWPSTTPISSPTARTAAVIMLNKGPTDGPSLSRAEEDGGSERELQSGNVADNRTVFEDLGNGHQREGDAQGLEKEARRNSEAGMSRGFGGWVNGRRWDSSDEVKNEASHHSRDQGYTYDQSPQGGNGGLRSERWVQEDNSPHKAANGGFSFRIPEGNQNLQNLLGKRDTASERTPQALGASPHQWPFHPASQNTMSAAESSSMPHPEVATTVQQQQQPLPAGSFPSYPPPAAFLGPKCALWDCLRPAQGDYCSELHAAMAATEGGNGRAPVVRPWGIELKDPLLLAALRARIAGKAVGIPDCEKAATAKSPWGAPELFDVNMLVGEPLREWLFFDKSQPAYGTGTRKQRALPDYSGRWHDSYKQHFKDHGGLKRILYLDPQPSGNVEWHLYEYELKGSSEWALYRLEMKKRDPTKAVNSVLIQSSQRGGHKSAFTVVKPRPL